MIVPAAFRLDLVAEPGERGRLPVTGENVNLAPDLRFLAGVANGFGQRQQRMAADLSRHRLKVDRADRRDEARRELLAVDVPIVLERSGDVPKALPVRRQERIDID